MADASVQVNVAKWIADHFLPEKYGQPFSKATLPTAWGAKSNVEAVSEDGQVAATITTSRLATSGGKAGVGKCHKVELDILRLYCTQVKSRIAVFTEPCMHEWATKARAQGKLPPDVQLVLAPIPPDLRTQLEQARSQASAEVSPQ